MKFIHQIKITFLLALMLISMMGCWESKKDVDQNAVMHLPLTRGVIDVAGCNLHYETLGAGDPIIVLHGGPGLDHGYLLPQMRWLATDHAVTFYDQRGSGQSWDTEINPDTINMDRFVQDLDAIRKRLRYQKFTLVGHSWGGLLAMQYAIKHPEHLSALILLNPAPATSTGFQAFFDEYAQRTAELKTDLETIQSSDMFKKGDGPTIAQFYRLVFSKYVENPEDAKKIALAFTPQSALNGFQISEIFMQNYLLKFYDLRAELNQLQIPTLIVHGSSDPIPIWTAREISDAIPGSEIVVLNHCGHFPYIEQPTEFFNLVKKFLREQQI